MRRPLNSNTTDAAGSDSFLDIVANIVGILIILVMVVGARVKNAPAVVEPAEEPAAAETDPARLRQLAGQLEKLDGQAHSLEGEVLEMAARMQQIERETEVRRAQRAQLALAAEFERRKLEELRRSLGADQQAVLEQQRKLDAARRALADLDRRIQEAEAEKPETVKVVNHPTPISQVVHGDEVHFQIRGGRIAYVPLDMLIERLRSESRQILWKLRDVPEVSGLVGPIADFRMRYTFHRVGSELRAGPRGRSVSIGGGTYAQLSEFTLIPTRSVLGEGLDAATRPRSNFRSRLALYDPKDTTVTLWVYPDSFVEFRALRQELYRLGYQIAARPLPHGAPIAGSPRGSKSAAQ